MTTKIDIKNHTYHFFDVIINIKKFDPNDIKIDEKSYKSIYYRAKKKLKNMKNCGVKSAI